MNYKLTSEPSGMGYLTLLFTLFDEDGGMHFTFGHVKYFWHKDMKKLVFCSTVIDWEVTTEEQAKELAKKHLKDKIGNLQKSL